jgi:ABC-2 type transport system permease protein
MVSTRKLDPDGLINSFVAIAVVVYSARRLGLHPDLVHIALYVGMLGCGLVIHYAAVLLVVSTTFWLIGSQGIEGTYFTLFEFSRLPRQAFRGVSNVLFVYALPAVVTTFVPARMLIHGFEPAYLFWLGGVALIWLALAIFVFNRGLRRYSSASS